MEGLGFRGARAKTRTVEMQTGGIFWEIGLLSYLLTGVRSLLTKTAVTTRKLTTRYR